ncbi:MAG: FHA domain-containing protein [Propionibacteriaceae bacterium]|nr:FHA domain-containing protein [Propionibacteriaceae bacterium]
MIVGRKPKAARFSGSDIPRLVTLNGDLPDISRSHLRITLQDWNVMVADMGSTNGTILLRAGQPDRRLQAQEDVMALDGDVYDLGNGITITLVGLR